MIPENVTLNQFIYNKVYHVKFNLFMGGGLDYFYQYHSL